MSSSPSLNGGNGRNALGRFAPGNPGGPGNPHSKKVNALRTALLRAVTQKDIEAIVKQLIEKAKAGDVHAAREVFDRCFGKARLSVDMEVEVDTAADKLDRQFAEMTPLELAEILEQGGQPLPGVLAKLRQANQPAKAVKNKATTTSRSPAKSKKKARKARGK